MELKLTQKMKIVALVCSIFLLAAGCNKSSPNNQVDPDNSLASQTNNQQNNTTPNTASSNSSNDLEVKFTGTIKAVKNEMPFDGNLSIQVDDKWVAIDGGMIANTPKGTVTGLNTNASDLEKSIGSKVEVYAIQVSSQNETNLSILGNTKYYVRVVQ